LKAILCYSHNLLISFQKLINGRIRKALRNKKQSSTPIYGEMVQEGIASSFTRRKEGYSAHKRYKEK